MVKDSFGVLLNELRRKEYIITRAILVAIHPQLFLRSKQLKTFLSILSFIGYLKLGQIYHASYARQKLIFYNLGPGHEALSDVLLFK